MTMDAINQPLCRELQPPFAALLLIAPFSVESPPTAYMWKVKSWSQFVELCTHVIFFKPESRFSCFPSLVFEDLGETWSIQAKKNLSEQGQKPTTNSTNELISSIWDQSRIDRGMVPTLLCDFWLAPLTRVEVCTIPVIILSYSWNFIPKNVLLLVTLGSYKFVLYTNKTVAKVSACAGNIAKSMISEGNSVPLDILFPFI